MKKMLVVFVVIACLFASACSPKHELVGKWEYEAGSWIYFFGDSGIIEFSANGNVKAVDEDETGKWTSAEQGRLKVVDSDDYDFEYRYVIVNNKLTITDEDGDAAIFTKK